MATESKAMILPRPIPPTAIALPMPIPPIIIPPEIPPVAESCVRDLLQDLTFSGHHINVPTGNLWTLCDAKHCNYIIKQIFKQEHTLEYFNGESYNAQIASKLGVGPVVYRFTNCMSKKTGETDEYIIFQKLSGPTLAEDYPYNPLYIKQGLDLYYKLLTEANMVQNDLHAGNLMFDGPERRLYLIDYGVAQIIPKKFTTEEVKDYMQFAAELLVYALGETPKAEADKDIEFKKASAVTFQKAIDEWMAAKFT